MTPLEARRAVERRILAGTIAYNMVRSPRTGAARDFASSPTAQSIYVSDTHYAYDRLMSAGETCPCLVCEVGRSLK